MRFLPLILIIGILFNSAVVLVFRIKAERDYTRRYVVFREQIQGQMTSLTTEALSRIDAYFISNRVAFVHSSPSSSSPVSSPSPFYEDSGDWDYHYMRVDGSPIARVGFTDFYIGSSFPRGGTITSIYPDGVCVDGRFFFSNSSRSSPVSLTFPDKLNNTKKEVVQK